jgi:hypothetical protein
VNFRLQSDLLGHDITLGCPPVPGRVHLNADIVLPFILYSIFQDYCHREQEHVADVRQQPPKQTAKDVSMLGWGGSTSLKLDTMKNHLKQDSTKSKTMHTLALEWKARVTGVARPSSGTASVDESPIATSYKPLRLREKLEWAGRFSILLWLVCHFVRVVF